VNAGISLAAAAAGIVSDAGAAKAIGLGLKATADAVDAISAADRAAQIAASLGKTANYVTVGVTDTAEGIRLVSSSEFALRPAARAALQDGEIAVTGIGHTEVTGVNAALDMGLTPIGTAASRPICPSCAQFLDNANVPPLSPLKKP